MKNFRPLKHSSRRVDRQAKKRRYLKYFVYHKLVAEIHKEPPQTSKTEKSQSAEKCRHFAKRGPPAPAAGGGILGLAVFRTMSYSSGPHAHPQMGHREDSGSTGTRISQPLLPSSLAQHSGNLLSASPLIKTYHRPASKCTSGSFSVAARQSTPPERPPKGRRGQRSMAQAPLCVRENTREVLHTQHSQTLHTTSRRRSQTEGTNHPDSTAGFDGGQS